jgi:Proteasome maturation factor UMP1.
MEDFTNSKKYLARQEQEKMKMLAVTYGSALPFALLMERNLLAQRPNGIRNGNFGLDISLGRNTELAFSTFILITVLPLS